VGRCDRRNSQALRSVRRSALTLLFLSLLLAPLAGMDLLEERVLPLIPDQFEYEVTSHAIIAGSELVYADSLALLPGIDYKLEPRHGKLILLRFPDAEYLKISCLLVPPELAEPRFVYREFEPVDSLFQSIKPRSRSLVPDEGKLLISGAKTFAISFSDESSFDLKQSLFVNLDGELGKNVNIAARLSDSQSKLAPEGDSKELSSLDRVFVKVYGRQYEIAMGDLDWEYTGTRYINYRASIEGLNAWWRDKHFAQAGYTASSGKPANQQIRIIEGKQGPYRLNPTGFQSSSLIIAGSESIYQNGRLLERGTDYYIDYSDGSVMFKTLVVSTDLIKAWYQFSDEYYRQSTLFNSSEFHILPGLRLSHHFIWQADAKNNPLLHDFSPADLDSLALAGDRVVWGSGIIEVDPSFGEYILKEDADGVQFFEYAPGDANATYNLTFSFVGLGNGDYEEFSSGKFRYAGMGLGSWLPQKRLVPPLRRSNADLALDFETGPLELGMEGIFSTNDKNTFSTLDDEDNLSGILNARARLKTGEPGAESWLGLNFEKRWANPFLFSQEAGFEEEFDLALLAAADSLAQWHLDFSLGSQALDWWKPRLLARYRHIPGVQTQKMLRLGSQSKGKSLLPSLDLRSTLAWQDPLDSESSSLMQYHDLAAGWELGNLKAKLLLNHNSLKHSEPKNTDSRYQRLNPQLSFISPAKNHLAQLSYSTDATSRYNQGWEPSNSSQTYALKHSSSALDHNLSMDLTHRRSNSEGVKNSYNLASFRNSHYFLKQAVMLMGNYQLNQTEFFPRIRELEYIGHGLGLYDSTGVYTPDGDWDWTYITSERGTLSSEVNGQLSFYLKPGNYFPKLKSLRADIILQSALQDSLMQGWQPWLLTPQAMFESPSAIYANSRMSQTLWMDILPGRVVANLGAQFNRNQDNRYQSRAHSSERLLSAETDLKNLAGNNLKLRYANSREEDSRYLSLVDKNEIQALIQRNFGTHSTGLLTLDGNLEKGSRLQSPEGYSLQSIGLEPGYRGIWGKTARASASVGFRYNRREGSDFLSFLPEKRGGILLNWALSAVYRLNSFSSASFEYRGNLYPQQGLKHTLKLEFKAEL